MGGPGALAEFMQALWMKTCPQDPEPHGPNWSSSPLSLSLASGDRSKRAKLKVPTAQGGRPVPSPSTLTLPCYTRVVGSIPCGEE